MRLCAQWSVSVSNPCCFVSMENLAMRIVYFAVRREVLVLVFCCCSAICLQLCAVVTGVCTFGDDDGKDDGMRDDDSGMGDGDDNRDGVDNDDDCSPWVKVRGNCEQ